MRFITVLFGVLLAATVYSQSIVTPVFVHKDGEATASGYTGTEKDILVDGTAQQSVGWITFQTGGVDFSKVTSARLTLYVKSLSAPGTLGIYPLTAAVTAPENNLPLATVPVGPTAAATVSLGTADVEKMVQVDVTALLKAGAFHGIALKSDDGLIAGFDSKEGRLAPVILLTHDIESAAAKWHSGTNVPAVGLGKDGDYYLNTATGDVSAKSSGAWSVVTNIVGPQGDPGVAFDDSQALSGKTWSSQKIQSVLNTKVTAVSGKGLSSNDYTDADSLRLAATSGTNTGDQDLSSYATTMAMNTALAGKVNTEAGKGLSTKDYTTADSTKLAGIAVDAVTNPGDMQYWDGTKWVMISVGQPGQALSLSGSSVPQWSQIPGTVTDIDGNVYRTIVIGNQEWTVTNIRTTHYSNGEAISNVTETTAWSNLSTGAYCFYSNSTVPADQQKWGALYNWYAVSDSRGLSPEGWRVPTNADWTALENFLTANGYNYDGTLNGNKIGKSMVAGIWTTSTTDGAVGNNLKTNNKSGFSALPGGYRYYNNDFFNKSDFGFWWSASATENDATNSWYRILYFDMSLLSSDNGSKNYGLSVRLVRDLN